MYNARRQPTPTNQKLELESNPFQLFSSVEVKHLEILNKIKRKGNIFKHNLKTSHHSMVISQKIESEFEPADIIDLDLGPYIDCNLKPILATQL